MNNEHINVNKKVNYILPLNRKLERIKSNKYVGNIAVLIHLHYLEKVKDYIKYINCIPKNMDLIFTVSDSRVEQAINVLMMEIKRKYKIIRKQNRGRDISALLVTCKEEILKYDYICFLHDKKEKNEIYKKDTELWIQCLWENMIGSKEFINNIVETFASNPMLGLLAPPPPISDHFTAAYVNTWFHNFSLAKELSKKLNLKCELNENESPFTLGTVFWAKVSALKKMLEMNWEYEDFDEEPMSDDGTISHAIERIFAYVVQDAGYDVGWVMTDSFAIQYTARMQVALAKTFAVLNETYGIKFISELDTFWNERDRLVYFCKMHKRTFIYGTGEYATTCYKLLSSAKKEIDGFVVSQKKANESTYLGHRILNREDAVKEKNIGIIVAVSWKYQDEILEQLFSKGMNENDVYVFQRI